ncbi:MAG: hypothetical protein AAGJ93_00425 [Bacteroidota bacterium]
MNFINEAYPQKNLKQILSPTPYKKTSFSKTPLFKSKYDKYWMRQPDKYSCWITSLRMMYAIKDDEDIRSKFKSSDERYKELERFLTEIFEDNNVNHEELLKLTKIRDRKRGLSPYMVGTFLLAAGLKTLGIEKGDLGPGTINPISVNDFSSKTIDKLLIEHQSLYVVIKPYTASAGYHAYVIVDQDNEYYKILEPGLSNLFTAQKQGVVQKVKDMIEEVKKTTIGFF